MSGVRKFVIWFNLCIVTKARDRRMPGSCFGLVAQSYFLKVLDSNKMKRICVYCGSSPGFSPLYMEMAEKLGQALIECNLELVYGGADVGLMGKVADTVLKAGGSVIGVIPKLFAHRASHQGLTNLD